MFIIEICIPGSQTKNNGFSVFVLSAFIPLFYLFFAFFRER